MTDANKVPKNNFKMQQQAKIAGIKNKGKKRNLKNYKNMTDDVDEPDPSKKRKLNTMITQSNFAKRPFEAQQQKNQINAQQRARKNTSATTLFPNSPSAKDSCFARNF